MFKTQNEATGTSQPLILLNKLVHDMISIYSTSETVPTIYACSTMGSDRRSHQCACPCACAPVRMHASCAHTDMFNMSKTRVQAKLRASGTGKFHAKNAISRSKSFGSLGSVPKLQPRATKPDQRSPKAQNTKPYAIFLLPSWPREPDLHTPPPAPQAPSTHPPQASQLNPDSQPI